VQQEGIFSESFCYVIVASLKKLFHFFYDLFMTAEELQKKNADQYTLPLICLLIRETASASDRPEKLFSAKSCASHLPD